MPDFQCAAVSRGRNEPIFATASQVRRWLLVEVRGSWGKDSVANTELGRHVDDDWRNGLRSAGIRILAIRRDLVRVAHDASRLLYVDSTPSGRAAWRRDIGALHEVADATATLRDDGSVAPEWTRHHEPIVLVCTNGKHDTCCATFGRPVVRALRMSEHADSVWECSHIGGDRFAGNIVLLPHGLYFGRCTPESGRAVVDAYRVGRIDLDHYRGRSTLAYMQQAAEFFTRRELHLTGIDDVSTIRRIGDAAEGRFVVALADGSVIAVKVRRSTEPISSPLTCTGPGDVTTTQYELVELEAAMSPSP